MTGKDLSEKSVKKSDTPLLFKGHRVAVDINTTNYMACTTRIMENRLTKQINADWFRRSSTSRLFVALAGPCQQFTQL